MIACFRHGHDSELWGTLACKRNRWKRNRKKQSRRKEWVRQTLLGFCSLYGEHARELGIRCQNSQERPQKKKTCSYFQFPSVGSSSMLPGTHRTSPRPQSGEGTVDAAHPMGIPMYDSHQLRQTTPTPGSWEFRNRSLPLVYTKDSQR